MKYIHLMLLFSIIYIFSNCSSSSDSGFSDPDTSPIPDKELVEVNITPQKPPDDTKDDSGQSGNDSKDNTFVNGDEMGVYIADYEGSSPATLLTHGNHADNVRFSFDGNTGKWVPAYDIYWKDQHTHADIYGYFPYTNVDDVTALKFDVQADQNSKTADGKDGYKVSDLSWTKVSNVAPTASNIRLPLHHCLACANIILKEGKGFKEGEWAMVDKNVLLPNLVRKALLNIADGVVKPNGDVEATATIPYRTDDGWKAIVVPQTVKAGTTMFTITVGGQPFNYKQSTDFTYAQDKVSNFTIEVDKRLPEGAYSMTLISHDITPWEEDTENYDANATAYVIVNATRGHLQEAVSKAHLDASKIRNIKITGVIDDDDFTYIKKSMTSIQRLNLKEATVYGQQRYEQDPTKDAMPIFGLSNNKTLMHVVFPESLKILSEGVFNLSTSLSGPLYIPEGCTEVGDGCFSNCTMLNDTLALPSTLEKIVSSAFFKCNFNCELKLPSKVKEIGAYAFFDNNSLHGNLKLPANLTKLGERAFYNCSGLRGDLVIPQKITAIEDRTFHNCDFDGTLTLHDGITSIKDGAFEGNHNLHGTLTLPKYLTILGADAFNGCGFNKIIIPEGMENIGNNAFVSCHAVKSIVCKAITPPLVGKEAFDGIDKENAVVEVPQQSVKSYKAANGWKEFKNIIAIRR